MSIYKPNYAMLRLRIMETEKIKNHSSDIDQMPKGAICPGFDIQLMQTLAVLKYICGVETQWSCQGNHINSEPKVAYILLPAGHLFPCDLVELLDRHKLKIKLVKDYDFELKETEKIRYIVRSTWNKNIGNEILTQENNNLLTVLNFWSESKIRDHLVHIQNDKYYDDFVRLYRL